MTTLTQTQILHNSLQSNGIVFGVRPSEGSGLFYSRWDVNQPKPRNFYPQGIGGQAEATENLNAVTKMAMQEAIHRTPKFSTPVMIVNGEQQRQELQNRLVGEWTDNYYITLLNDTVTGDGYVKSVKIVDISK